MIFLGIITIQTLQLMVILDDQTLLEYVYLSKILMPSLKDRKILAPTTTRLFEVSP